MLFRSTCIWTWPSGGSHPPATSSQKGGDLVPLADAVSSWGTAWIAVPISSYARYSAVKHFICILCVLHFLVLGIHHQTGFLDLNIVFASPYLYLLPFGVRLGSANTAVFWRTLSRHHDLILHTIFCSHPHATIQVGVIQNLLVAQWGVFWQ